MSSPLLISIRDTTSKPDMNIVYNRALFRMRDRWHARHRVNVRRMDVASRALSAIPIVKATMSPEYYKKKGIPNNINSECSKFGFRACGNTVPCTVPCVWRADTMPIQ